MEGEEVEAVLGEAPPNNLFDFLLPHEGRTSPAGCSLGTPSSRRLANDNE